MYLRRFLALVLVSGLMVLGAAPAAAAGFTKVGTLGFSWDSDLVGARLTSLGGADIAGEQGAEVVLANPAPLGFGTGVVAAYSRLDNYIFWDDGADLESLAVAGGWESLRVSFCRVGYGNDDVLLFLPWDPDGRHTSYHTSMTVLGLSWEPARRWLGSTFWRLAVGVNQRHYRYDRFGTVTTSDGWDAGATLGWERPLRGGGISLRGAWSKQNVSGATIKYFEEFPNSPLQQPWRGGVTARGHLNWPAASRELVALMLAYTHVEQAGDYFHDADQYGMELTLGGILAIRYGYDNDTVARPESWGMGLILDEHFMGPVQARVHWSRLNYDPDWIVSRDLWGVDVGIDF